MIFSAKNYASMASFEKVMPKNCRGPFFTTRCSELLEPEQLTDQQSSHNAEDAYA